MGRRGWLIEEINGQPAAQEPSSRFLLDAGFTVTALGLQLRVPKRPAIVDAVDAAVDDDA